MFGLADCNNFYASCERVFNPALIGKPVVVLSNNDGCVIARSNEAKAIGIPMGIPVFKIKDIIEKHNVNVFSSNYTLYGDFSHRVMTALAEFVPEIEIYSIDEAFLNFNGLEHLNYCDYGKKITKTIKRWTGIPISLGIAPSKALAKVANKIGKKNDGVCVLQTKDEIFDALANFPIEDVWGIGRQYSAFLKRYDITTALDFVKQNPQWIRKQMTVQGLRLWKELQGEHCLELEDAPAAKKNICTSRSFGKMLSELKPIEEALANYAARCAEKLRRQKSCCKTIMVFIHTNPHRKDLPQYARNIVLKLPEATNSTTEMIKHAIAGLNFIFKQGYHYKKAGIIAIDIIDENAVQGNLFYSEDKPRNKRAMAAIDTINKLYGRDTLKIAAQGTSRAWKLRQEKLSPCYTTRLSDLLEIGKSEK